jgi:purine catabolism regulator
MATLEELRLAVAPSAQVVSPNGGREGLGGLGAGTELAWVRLMKARVPAFDALEAGDVAILPSAAISVVAADRRGIADLVAACAAAGVAGLLLVPSDENATVLDVVGSEADSAGVPALRLTDADPAALERSVIGFLVNHRAELERQATLLEARLEEIALDGGGLVGMTAAIADFLGRAVAIEGPSGKALGVHAPLGVDDAAAAVAAYHRRRGAAALRVQLPAPIGQAGALALLGRRPASELERVATGRIAGLLALQLARDEAVGRARETARRDALPAAGPPWVVLVARQDRLVDAAGSGTMTPIERREATRRELRLLAPARRMTLRGDAESLELRAVAALDASDPAGIELARRIGGFLGRIVAVSRPFDVPAARPAAEADARATLEAAEALSEPPVVARADRLPAYRLLGNLHNLPDGARQARALLEPLLAGRPDVRRERLATLRAVLEQPGLAEAAAALGVHRNTIAYRMRRIEEATGWRLADPELRLPLALALRLVQRDQD